jgi:hypothetical protein
MKLLWSTLRNSDTKHKEVVMKVAMSKVKLFSAITMMSLMVASMMIPAEAASRYYRNYYDYNRPRTQAGRYFNDHPYVQKAVVIGGAGAAVGALTAGDGYRMDGAVKGALIGAGAGMGYEYLRQKNLLPW